MKPRYGEQDINIFFKEKERSRPAVPSVSSFVV